MMSHKIMSRGVDVRGVWALSCSDVDKSENKELEFINLIYFNE